LEELLVDSLVYAVPQLLISGCRYEVNHGVPGLGDNDFLGEDYRCLGQSVAEVQHTAGPLV
jgi:hypothetical protein